MSNIVILKWQPFEYKAKFEIKGLFCLGPKLVFLIYFSKVCIKKLLRIYESIVIEIFKLVPLCPIKCRPFKAFAKLLKSPILITSIVKGAVSGLEAVEKL